MQILKSIQSDFSTVVRWSTVLILCFSLMFNSVFAAEYTNKTTANDLGNDYVYGVYASGLNVYVATTGGLSFTTIPTPPSVSAPIFSLKDKPVMFSEELH